MLRPAPERQRWKLRSRLLLPMIALVLLGAIGLAVMGGVVVGDQAESLVGLHGDSVLAGLEAQLHDRQRSKEVFAELMAEESGVAFAVQESDKVGLARLMVPRQAKLGLGHIVVRTSSGQELLRLGARDPGVELDALATSALSGLTKSVSGVGDRGLEVWASAPIKGSTGIVGAMMVGVTLDEDALRAIGAQQKADLAVYRGGTLVATSVDRVGLRSALRESGSGPEGMEALRRKLAGFDIQPAARQVVDDGAVLARQRERPPGKERRPAEEIDERALPAGLVADDAHHAPIVQGGDEALHRAAFMHDGAALGFAVGHEQPVQAWELALRARQCDDRVATQRRSDRGNFPVAVVAGEQDDGAAGGGCLLEPVQPLDGHIPVHVRGVHGRQAQHLDHRGAQELVTAADGRAHLARHQLPIEGGAQVGHGQPGALA